MPPDILGCARYPAAEWPEMRDKFLKLCGDDPVCAVQLPAWRARLATWDYPSDAGTCITWMTATVLDVDAQHPLPAKYTATGKPKTWPEVMVGGVTLPAKESVAPLKTFVQSFCHDEKDCGSAGNWQGTVKAVDASQLKQSNLVGTMAMPGGSQPKPPPNAFVTPVVKSIQKQ